MLLHQMFSEKYFWHRRSRYDPLKFLQKESEYLNLNSLVALHKILLAGTGLSISPE